MLPTAFSGMIWCSVCSMTSISGKFICDSLPLREGGWWKVPKPSSSSAWDMIFCFISAASISACILCCSIARVSCRAFSSNCWVSLCDCNFFFWTAKSAAASTCMSRKLELALVELEYFELEIALDLLDEVIEEGALLLDSTSATDGRANRSGVVWPVPMLACGVSLISCSGVLLLALNLFIFSRTRVTRFLQSASVPSIWLISFWSGSTLSSVDFRELWVVIIFCSPCFNSACMAVNLLYVTSSATSSLRKDSWIVLQFSMMSNNCLVICCTSNRLHFLGQLSLSNCAIIVLSEFTEPTLVASWSVSLKALGKSEFWLCAITGWYCLNKKSKRIYRAKY